MTENLPSITLNEYHRLLRFVVALDEVLPVYEGATYEGCTLKRDGADWLLVVRCRRKKRYKVAFYRAHRPWACWMAFARELKHGKVWWKPDRYPPNVGD